MRYASIDILRTIAIVVMVLVHFSENLAGFTPPIAGLGAPLFAFLSGVSYQLWVRGHELRGTDAADISRISVRRGLFIFGIGFVFNILVWLPEDVFNWDVLTFIGAALLFLNLARRLPRPICILLAVLITLISPVLQSVADFQAYWPDGYFDPDLTLSDVTVGFIATGYFPLFPWLSFSVAGLVSAAMLFRSPSDVSGSKPSPWTLVLLGAGLIVLAITTLGVRSVLPTGAATKFLGGWTMFPATIVYVLSTLGAAICLLGLGHRFIDENEAVLRHRAALAIAKTFSRYSLTIYVAHHIVHLWPLWLYGIAAGQEATFYWMKAMSLQWAIALAVVYLILSYFLLRKLGPERTYGLESWMRWLCD